MPKLLLSKTLSKLSNKPKNALKNNLLSLAKLPNKFSLIGVMSGTSLDGLDIALVEFNLKHLKGSLAKGGLKLAFGQSLNFNQKSSLSGLKLIKFFSYAYTKELKHKILDTINSDSIKAASNLNFELGHFYAENINKFIKHQKLTNYQILAVAMISQTIYHQHQKSTYQIAEADCIAKQTNLPVIYDFRTADVAVGGSGAPLVVLLDAFLTKSLAQKAVTKGLGHKKILEDELFKFKKEVKKNLANSLLAKPLLVKKPSQTNFKPFKKPLAKTLGHYAFLNLGGIGNVSFIRQDGRVLSSFDTGPANLMSNIFTSFATDKRLFFDKDAKLALKGRLDDKLLKKMLKHEFLAKSPPKSTGHEQFGLTYCKGLVKQFDQLKMCDFVHTSLVFCALSIRQALQKFGNWPLNKLILSGGGVHNPLLLSYIKHLVKPVEVVLFSKEFGIADDAKEAVLSAFLGVFRLLDKPANFKHLTGASRKVCLGKIALP